MSKVAVDYAGTIQVGKGTSPINLYLHQVEAIRSLDEKIKADKYPFAGLLVLPTGGGKTLTVAHWLLRNYIDNGKKVLWIAHRHELLDQAFLAFKNNAYSNLLRSRRSFNYRVISGMHDKPVHIKGADDIIIASKDSLYRDGALKYLLDWIKSNHDNELFLAIDEAHHAIAKTYRKLIDFLKENVASLRMLGITATPFRTAQNEQGLLHKVFADDIVYKTNLQTLISRGILAEPIFEELQTGFDMTEMLTDKDWRKIQFSDIGGIGKEIAETIAKNRTRNNRIVNHYVENQDKYDQTLVFALNIDNAIALNALFKDKGITSDYIVSSMKDAFTGATLSPQERKQKVARFRKGELKVLINVNILTEGTDLPNVQTVFLTRPTISKVLMTQMIGRGLRGEKVGGTKDCYIVSFIDDWKDKVVWVNPEKLITEEEVIFPPDDDNPDLKKKLVRLISIDKIEEFARIMDKAVDTTELEKLDFIARIPVGLYSFSILKSSESQEEIEKNCEILVYDNIQQAYIDFINDLPEVFKIYDLSDKEMFGDDELDVLCQKVEDEYFYGYEKLPGYRVEDVKDVLRYYVLYEVQPQFIEFKDRHKFDVSRIAEEIFDKGLGGVDIREYVYKAWHDDETAWRAFFGYAREYFVNEVLLAYKKIIFRDDFIKAIVAPKDDKELRELEKLSLSELREKAPEYWRKLTNEVYEKSKDKDGCYTSAMSGCGSKYKINFHIDHRIPFSRGGLTTLDNLQILTREENVVKGTKTIDFQERRTPLTSPLAEFYEFELPRAEKVRDNEAWEQFIRRSINFFYRCSAVESVDIGGSQWFVKLHTGNNPRWLEQHLDSLKSRIRNVQRETGLQQLDGIKVDKERNPDPKPQAYCMKCKIKRPMRNPKPVKSRGGQFVLKGHCAICDTKMSLFVSAQTWEQFAA